MSEHDDKMRSLQAAIDCAMTPEALDAARAALDRYCDEQHAANPIPPKPFCWACGTRHDDTEICIPRSE